MALAIFEGCRAVIFERIAHVALTFGEEGQAMSVFKELMTGLFG